LQWVKNQGGLAAMEANSKAKSELLYNAIENSRGFYLCPIKTNSRSRITVPFRLAAGDEADKKFLKEAQDLGFLQLKGHRYPYENVHSGEMTYYILYKFLVYSFADWWEASA